MCIAIRGSECRIVSFGFGVRRIGAMPSASRTSSVWIWGAIDQPMIRRDQASITAAEYSLPSAPGGPPAAVAPARRGRQAHSAVVQRECATLGGTMRILVVEDEPRLADGLRAGLEADGFAVDVALTGNDGL